MKGQVLTGFLFGFVFAASASAQINVPLVTSSRGPGDSDIPEYLANRDITDPVPPERVHTPGFGLLPPTLSSLRVFIPGFTYPAPWGPWKKNVEFHCINILHGSVPGTMRLTWERKPQSFGHDHSGTSGPAGKFDGQESPYVFSVPRNVLYETPEVSGIIEAKMECDNNGIVHDDLIIAVGVRGLYSTLVADSKTYELTGVKCDNVNTPNAGGDGVVCDNNENTLVRHSSNHYGVPELNTAITELAAEYQKETGLRLPVNDMSLRYGGTFDFRNTWTKPHSRHSLGIDVDINLHDDVYYTHPTDPEIREKLKARTKMDALAPKHKLKFLPESAALDAIHAHLVLK